MHRPSITFYSGAVFLAGEEGQLVALGGVLAGAIAVLSGHFCEYSFTRLFGFADSGQADQGE